MDHEAYDRIQKYRFNHLYDFNLCHRDDRIRRNRFAYPILFRFTCICLYHRIVIKCLRYRCSHLWPIITDRDDQTCSKATADWTHGHIYMQQRDGGNGSQF